MIANYIVRNLVHAARFTLLGSQRVTGREHVPKEGPYLIIINHVGLADGPMVLISMPPTEISFLAGEKWKKHPIFGPAMWWLGGIFIDRHKVDRQSLKRILQAAKDGKVVALAPEGTRSKDGKMHKAKNGVAYLAARMNIPILPIGLVNTEGLFTNAIRLRRTRLEAHFGPVFHIPDIGHLPRGVEMDALTHYMMVHIAALIPERYHGFYAGSPGLHALQAGEDTWEACLSAEKAARGK